MARKHLTCEEVDLVTELIASSSFRRSIGQPNFYKHLGEMCVEKNVNHTSKYIRGLIEPRITAFFGENAGPILEKPSSQSIIQHDALFEGLSDGQLLKGSSFANNLADTIQPQVTQPPQDIVTDNLNANDGHDLDLLDADSWYRGKT